MDATVDAGWSSLVARRAHNPKVVGSNPAPATNYIALSHCGAVWQTEAPLWGFLLGAGKAPGTAGKDAKQLHSGALEMGLIGPFFGFGE